MSWADLETAIKGADNISCIYISGRLDDKLLRENLAKKFSGEALEKEFSRIKKLYKAGRAYAKKFAEYGSNPEEVLDNIKAHSKRFKTCSAGVTGLKVKYSKRNLKHLTDKEIECLQYFGLLEQSPAN